MSKENLEQFMSKVADSEELQAKIGEQIDAEALIGLGAECGCEFTAEELQEAAELSDDELDEVAGGKGSRFDVREGHDALSPAYYAWMRAYAQRCCDEGEGDSAKPWPKRWT